MTTGGPMTGGDGRQLLALATSMVRLGRLDAAEEICARATAASPDDPLTWTTLAQFRDLRRAHAEAAAAWAAAGLCERNLGHPLAAIRCLRRALTRDPTHRTGQRELARLLAALTARHPPRLAARRSPGPQDGPSLSVVLCSPDVERSATATDHWRTALAGRHGQVIPIIDPPSLAAGYNAGLARADGDIVVFSHDDVTLPDPDTADRIVAHLARVDVLGLAGTTRLTGPGWISAGWPHVRGQVIHAIPPADILPGGGYSVSIYYPFDGLMGGIQALDGLFLAARRPAAAAIGFDAQTFRGFHLYDIDFSFRAHLAGLSLGVAGDIAVIHASAGHYDAAWAEAADLFTRKFAGHLGMPVPQADTFLQADFPSAGDAMRFCRTLARLTPPPPCPPPP